MEQSTEQRFTFGSKADTLDCLSSTVFLSCVPEFIYFTVRNWQKRPSSILEEIKSRFGNINVIIRSSSLSEDSDLVSLAGLHDSIMNVKADDCRLLSESINKVIMSYERSAKDASQSNQVIVQQMIGGISMSGVVFTRDLNTGAPYYVVNYDDVTGCTDTITGGKEYSNRTLIVHREDVKSLQSARFKALLLSIEEIERITGYTSLDIEFAVDKNNKVYIFQVRKITTQFIWSRSIAVKISDAVKRMRDFFDNYCKPAPGLYGETTILGTMPDWNPAEMIGATPRPLAMSLYRYLITDYAWRKGRKEMGYAEPRGARLMVSLFGKPYIDTRLSFNSFLPVNLKPQIAEKLVNAWLNILSEHKELHDKIEFEVATTALDFAFDDIMNKRMKGILSRAEKKQYRKALFDLTEDLLRGKKASIATGLKKINKLELYRERLLGVYGSPELQTVSALLENCIQWGTIPFSVLARHAFIAKSFIRSIVHRGILSEKEAFAFQRSIKTVATNLVGDINNFLMNNVSLETFMEKNGHLRPGTYDILSKRYDQRDDLLGGIEKEPLKPYANEKFKFSDKQIKMIGKELRRCGYSISAEYLLKYIKKAVTSREYSKFIFTKTISDALEIIALWGERTGLNREEISYLDINDILDARNVAVGKTLKQHLSSLAQLGRESHEITSAIRLPFLIERKEDVSIVPLLLHKPNYITQKSARGQRVFIDGKCERLPDITNKIVLIENADPGFDWIFSRPLLGVITKYGGANSHMAIRCAEFGLPAAIGCGEQIFDRVLNSRSIELNCSEGRIETLEA